MDMITLQEQQGLTGMTVADIVIQYPHSREIFERYDLDFCCGGKIPLATACEKAGLEASAIEEEILQTQSTAATLSGIRFEKLQTPLLIDFILQHHHTYVREAIPQIAELLDRVVEAHGADQPELKRVRENFLMLAAELLDHMPKEEQVLFPLIRKMSEAATGGEIYKNTVQTPVKVMEHEHESAGNLVKALRTLTDHYTIPAHACPTYRITYTMLQEFDNDLMQHIHLENNILFPRVK
jgi:regulator of cell morphogenesis and NO signaling